MKFIDGAKARLDAWNAERKAKAEEKRRVRELAAAQDSHHHSRFWLLNVPALATVCAAVVEWYWAVLFCIEATGRLGMDWATSAGSEGPTSGAWHFLFDIQNVWVLIGLILATLPIVMLSMIWLPVQFAMRGAGRMRRGSLIAVGVLANILVIVSGTVVMNYNRQDQVRADLVVEQSADAQRAMLTANVDDLRDELRTLMTHESRYIATAASVGAASYERDYVAQARATNDPRLPLLERALGAARRADELRAQIRDARANVAAAAPAAASAATVEDTVGRELNTFAQYVEVWRPPFVAFICTLIGIFGAWWVLAMLERLNPKDVIRSGWAPEGMRIEDMRDEPVRATEPMTPPQQKRRVYNPETGQEEVFVQPKGHWRPTGRKKQRADGSVAEEVEFQPEVPPDEKGAAYDSGGRVGSVAASAASASDVSLNTATDENAANEPEPVEPLRDGHVDPVTEHVEQPEISQEQIDEYIAANILQDEPPADEPPAEAEHVELPDGEGVMNTEEQREPETREERLLPASVAAE